MLTVERVNCYVDGAHILKDVSLRLGAGEVLALLGRNGTGKTTTLRTIMGLVRPRSGTVTLDGTDLTGMDAHRIPRLGMAYVPQGRRLFGEMTVAENLTMGLLVRGGTEATREAVLELMPGLRERLRQRAGTLSGGEQQMLAIARALCASPRVLLLDEPAEGLMPALVQKVLDIVAVLRERGVSVLLVEQRIEAALKVADRAALMDNGTVQHETTARDLAGRRDLLEKYLGVRRA